MVLPSDAPTTYCDEHYFFFDHAQKSRACLLNRRQPRLLTLAYCSREKTMVRVRHSTIGILCHCGYENFGIEAIITVVIDNLRRRLADVRL